MTTWWELLPLKLGINAQSMPYLTRTGQSNSTSYSVYVPVYIIIPIEA